MNRKRTLKPPSRRRQGRRGQCFERQAVRHARNRLGERYGLYVSTAEYWALVESIRQPVAGAPPLRRLYDPDRRTRWYLLRVQSRPVLAVYDPYWRRIRTFLTLGDLALIGLRTEDVA